MVMSAVDTILRGFANFMDSMPPVVNFLPLAFLVVPPLALIHELGHAAAALVLRPGERVGVVVGRPPHLVRFVLGGRLFIAYRPLLPLWRIDGVCIYENMASPTVHAVIASAGPAATLATCLIAWNALALVGPGMLHDILWTIVLFELFSFVGNMLPLTSQDGKRSDGATILAGFR